MNSENSSATLLSSIAKLNLVIKIAIGIVLGAIVGGVLPELGTSVSILGALFVAALKALAPVLIFLLVIASLATHQQGQQSHMRPILVLYLIGTLTAATTAVMLSFMFPTSLTLVGAEASNSAPQGIGEVLNTLLFKIVDNPVNALLSGNYVGILAWAIGLGILLRKANDSTKSILSDISGAVVGLVEFVIQLAPIGIFGLVASRHHVDYCIDSEPCHCLLYDQDQPLPSYFHLSKRKRNHRIFYT